MVSLPGDASSDGGLLMPCSFEFCGLAAVSGAQTADYFEQAGTVSDSYTGGNREHCHAARILVMYQASDACANPDGDYTGP